MSEWISVNDSLPDHTDDVLFIDDRGRMAVSCYFEALGKMWTWEIRDDQLGLGEVTHWMPLPEGPYIMFDKEE